MVERHGRARSRMGREVASALAEGRFELPRCGACGALQYPPAELCRACLGDDIVMQRCDPGGRVVAGALVARSYAADFSGDGSWPVVAVKMTEGPIVFAHALEVFDPDTEVTLVPITDRLGDGVLGAVRGPDGRQALMAKFKVTG